MSGQIQHLSPWERIKKDKDEREKRERGGQNREREGEKREKAEMNNLN